jgi:hypothetical protein
MIEDDCCKPGWEDTYTKSSVKPYWRLLSLAANLASLMLISIYEMLLDSRKTTASPDGSLPPVLWTFTQCRPDT